MAKKRKKFLDHKSRGYDIIAAGIIKQLLKEQRQDKIIEQGKKKYSFGQMIHLIENGRKAGVKYVCGLIEAERALVKVINKIA